MFRSPTSRSLTIAELEHRADTPSRFSALRDLPRAVFLDSAAGASSAGRYDILAADPYLTVTTRGPDSEIIRRDGTRELTREPPLALLQRLLGDRRPAPDMLPFAGGAIGYLGYDLGGYDPGRRPERLPSGAVADIDMPDMAFGLYDWAVVADHLQHRSWLVAQGSDARTGERWQWLLDRLHEKPAATPRPFQVLSPVASNLDRAAYERAFRRIKDYIRAGDVYQVNLTQRFSARVSGDPWDAYLKLRSINPAPFSAFLDLPEGIVLSSSPERFLKVVGEQVETRPIKGTRPRAADRSRDRALAEELRASPKDRAENVMIVDLLRNDLGKTCVPGSIEASKLFDVESFASVHHLVSTVHGRLAADRHALDVVAGAFPGGSITGAPKLRAMQIIEELEPHRRSVYCGAIGYVGFDGNMDLNIAIRTLLQCGDRIHAWAGGGVVADSECGAEYQESLDKAAALLEVLHRAGSPLAL